MNLLDTNVVLRYLLNDVGVLSEKAARLIDSERDFGVTAVVIAEIGFTLTKFYRMPRAATVEAIAKFIQKHNIFIQDLDKATVIDSLRFCQASNRVSFADAMIWAAARCTEDSRIYTFDNRFPSDGVEIVK